MYVSWDGPMEGGREDYFEVTFQKKNSSGEYEDSYFSPITTSDRYLYKTELSLNWENSYNDVGSYKVIVTAVNQVDGVEYRTESDPFYFEMGYTPRLTLTGGEDFVQLSWLDPTIDASTEDYEVWRKEEYGLWEKLPVPSGSISYDGTAFSYTDNTVTSRTKYHYYVVRNKNGNERASGEKVVTPMLLPGAPSALTVKRLSGSDMLVSWNAPTNGGSVGGYIIQAYYDYDGGTWEDIYTIHTPTTSCFEYIYMDRIRVVAFNDGGRGPASEEFVTTDLPENTASEYPPYVWPDSTSGDATVTVTWEHNNYTGDSATQYFEIVRSKNDETKQKVAIIPADPSRTSYSWTDPDVENGNHYEYWVHACNSQGYKTNTGGWGGVLEYSTWASPEGKTPNSDQIVAQTVEDLISELPDPDVLDPEDADAVSQIREVQSIYEGLTDAQLQEINEAERQKIEALIEMLDHADAEDKYEGNTAVASVEELIANLPATEDITVDSLNEDLVAQVTEARQGYAALPDDAKRIVDTAKLDAAEQKIRQLQKQAADREIVENVIAEIEALPAPDQVTIDNAQQVTSQTDWARTLYNSLTPSQKTLMAGMERGAAAIEKLDSLEEVLELLKVSEEDRTAAATVTALVDSIKDIPELTAADEASVTSARNAYNNLTADQKKLISAETLTKLEEAEGRILLLKAADQVIRMINDLPAITEIRVEDAEQIEAARAAYEALSAEEKALIPAQTLQSLEDAEARLEEVTPEAADAVSRMINDLPALDDITLDNADQVDAAKAAYDALSDEAKEMVPDEVKQRLDEAVEKARELRKSGWASENGKWYYYINGIKQTGWLKSGNVWYYMNEAGEMMTGWQKVNGTWYYLQSSGAMATGWQKVNGTWYYFAGSGAMVTGWQKISGTWYYFAGSGAMVTGWQKIGGVWYYFKSSGAMAANEWCGGYWLNANGSWTYQPRGSWKKDSTGWWFGDTSGWYAKSTTQKIDGVNYTFNAAGYWVN